MILGLAPMDWVTDYPYRMIVEDIFRRYGDRERHTLQKRTEFMSADGYMINPSRLVKHLIKSEEEKTLIAQIYGWNLDTLVKTAQDIERKYPWFMGIELNIWCPSPKILSGGAGSGMMRDKMKTLEYIKTLSENISLPFSIKTRSWLTKDDKDEQFKFIMDAARYCETISIHGRIYTQAHSWEVDWDYIYKVKQELGKDCTIIGNGGISSYREAMEKVQNLDGVMIGQSAIGNPRIFTSHIPSYHERIDLSRDHLILMASYEVYMHQTQMAYPEMSDQLALNRLHLHISKKYNPDSDEFTKLPNIDFHDYIFPMPRDDIIQRYCAIIEKHIKENNSTIVDFGDFIYNLNDLRCGIEFRKYVFGYIRWYSNTKEIKQKLIATTDIQKIYHILSDGKWDSL